MDRTTATGATIRVLSLLLILPYYHHHRFVSLPYHQQHHLSCHIGLVRVDTYTDGHWWTHTQTTHRDTGNPSLNTLFHPSHPFLLKLHTTRILSDTLLFNASQDNKLCTVWSRGVLGGDHTSVVSSVIRSCCDHGSSVSSSLCVSSSC